MHQQVPLFQRGLLLELLWYNRTGVRVWAGLWRIQVWCV